jgi:carboxyl-terminal processing protease
MSRFVLNPASRFRTVAATLILIASPALAAQHAEAPLKGANQAQQKDWEEGLTLLGSGQFGEASKLIHSVAAEAKDAQVREIDGWVRAFDKIQTDRTGRIREDYDKYVQWAQEEAGKGDWRKAAWYCGLAFNDAADQDAFRKESWLVKLVDGSKKAAEDFEKDRKWVKAASIWVRFAEIYPREKLYRDAVDRCQAHIRLEYTYTPESDWKAAVSDIIPEMARDAFRKIDAEYLKEPSFKDATVAGLKQALRLASEPKLEKVFATLKDKDAVQEFTRRVQVRLQQAEDSEKLTVRDLLSNFDRVLEINDETKLFPKNVLVYEFVQGALQPLDRFSDMIWPADLQEFNKHTQGRFSGVGIQIRKPPGEPIQVVTPLEDTPAYSAGIQPNDVIVKINGRSATKYTINQAVREITGPPGTSVILTIKRAGSDKEFDVELERQEITIFTIKGFERDDKGQWKYMIDPVQKIGYIRMTNFTEGTIDELKDVITKLRREEGMRGLIFDLRGNPGGPLKSAVEVSDLFLGNDKRIVSTRDRHNKDWSMSSASDQVHFTDFPMIIVANRFSASASEIVTGALQYHQRALIVGERTYGKGSVQQIMRLNNANSAFLKLTTAHYYLPDGRCLHREDDSVTWGVDPDVDVKLVPKEIVKSNDLRLKTDILKGVHQKQLTAEELKAVTEYKPTTKPAKATTQPGGDEVTTKPGDDAAEDEVADELRDDPNGFPEQDPQLEAALLVMRVRLESQQPWPMRTTKVAANATPASGG